MAVPVESIEQAVTKLEVHDHACLLYESQDELLAASIPFMKAGLTRGHFCGYIVNEQRVEAIRAGLVSEGIAVAEEEREGRLSFLTQREGYLEDGVFNLERMFQFIAETASACQSKGFSVVRCAGDMTWQIGTKISHQAVLKYEATLNQIFSRVPFIGICQYSISDFSPLILGSVLKTHPIVIYKNTVCTNHYYVPPTELLAEEHDPLAEVNRLLNNILERERTGLQMQQLVRELQQSRQELVEKIHELERFHDVTVDRELKMIELEKRLGKPTSSEQAGGR